MVDYKAVSISSSSGSLAPPTGDTILEDIFKLGIWPVKVSLSSTGIMWTPYSPASVFPFRTNVCQGSVSFEEILSASQESKPRICSTPFCCTGRGCKQHLIVIHTFQRNRRKRCVWTPCSIVLVCRDETVALEWVSRINFEVLSLRQRPKALLVLLNPFGGSKQARRVWDEIAHPILKRAGVRCTAIETQRAGHASEIVGALDEAKCAEYDGIVAVGGDGLFQEVIGGFLALRMAGGARAQALAGLRLGHIPSGSTDSVAYSINGTRSQATAALHIALGDRTALDVMRVDTAARQRCWAVCVASYGYLGDLMATSERLRWMGPGRYDAAGALTLFRNKSYRARIRYLPAASPLTQQVVCQSNCHMCSVADEPLISPGPSTSAAGGGSPEGAERAGSGYLSDGEEEEGWVTIEGDFKLIMAVVSPCRSDRSALGLLPYGHLSDGRIHLIMVKKCSIAAYFRFLLSIPSGGIQADRFSYVESVAVSAVRVEPAGRESSWNVDGELLQNNTISAHVHRGLVDMFSRGIEPDGYDKQF